MKTKAIPSPEVKFGLFFFNYQIPLVSPNWMILDTLGWFEERLNLPKLYILHTIQTKELEG